MTVTQARTIGVIEPGGAAYRELLAWLAEGASARDLRDENPFEQIDALRWAGFGALRLPREIGGAGLGIRDLFAVVVDIAEADPIVAHILRAHYWFVEERLRQATAADYPGLEHDRWLTLVRGGALFGNASSELGTQAAGNFQYATTLTARDDGYSLTGEKFYSTGTLFADYLTTWADQGGTAVASVVVPVTREGVAVIDDWDGIGQRRTGTGTTRFSDVLVSEDEIVSRVALDADAEPTYQFAFLQLYLQAVISGILRSVTYDAVRVVACRQRGFSHGPTPDLSQDPLLQNIIGTLSSTAFAAESVTLAAADVIGTAAAAVSNGSVDAELAAAASRRAAQAKVHVDTIAVAAASTLFEVGGASASSRAKNLDRHWRNIRTITLHNPVVYKAQALGNHLLTGEPLPANGYF